MSNTISQVRSQLAKALFPLYGEQEAGQMIKILFEHFCGISGTSMTLRKNEFLPDSQYVKLQEALQKLSDHIPIQYITGKTWFYNQNFEVNPSVLIPRPETEELVDLIVTETNKPFIRNDYRLLDIGTGSGCIAVSIKKVFPNLEVNACDISEDALLVARRNAELAGTSVHFFKADILQWREWADNSLFNLIVSNPPYVCEQEKSQMQPNVLEHEPAMALFVPDDDPLKFYRAIAAFAVSRLAQDGRLFFEINENFGHETSLLLDSLGFSDIKVRKDFRGKDRFITATK